MSHPLVVLIVEDKSDGKALQILAKKMGLPVNIDPIPAKGIGNIKARGKQLIRLARDHIKKNDGNGCIAILIDNDGKNARRDEPHRSIRELCQQEQVAFLTAVEALEAWLLADERCARWLGVARPKNADAIADPKQIVASAYEKKNPTHKYQRRRARRLLAEKCDGSGPQRSPSMKKVLDHLANSPCISGK